MLAETLNQPWMALGVQLIQAALGPPGSDALGGSSTRSCSITTPTHSHKAWTYKGGHVIDIYPARALNNLQSAFIPFHQMKNQSPPLIFCHYGLAQYLEITLSHARKSNPLKQCILIGDEKNRQVAEAAGWDHIDLRDLNSQKRDEFNARFFWVQGPLHNPVKGGRDWLRFVSERFYALEVLLDSCGHVACWFFDSDTLILDNLDQYEAEFLAKKIDSTTQCNGSCPSGLMTSRFVNMYCDSMIEDYKDIPFLQKQQLEFDACSKSYAFTEMRAFERMTTKYQLRTDRLSWLYSPRGVWFDDCICQEHGLRMALNINLLKRIKDVHVFRGSLYCTHHDSTSYRMATINCSWIDVSTIQWLSDAVNFTDSNPTRLVRSLKIKPLLVIRSIISRLFWSVRGLISVFPKKPA